MDNQSRDKLIEQLMKIPGLSETLKKALIIPRFEVDEADAAVVVEYAKENPAIVLEALVLVDGLVKARAQNRSDAEVIYLASMWDISSTYQGHEALRAVGSKAIGRSKDQAIAQA